MTSPARDVPLADWLDGVAHHAPTTNATVLAHTVVRRLVADLGTTLFQILPPGRDKILVFTALEDVLMRANRAVAISGGPAPHVTEEDLDGLLADKGPVGTGAQERAERSTGVTGDGPEAAQVHAAALSGAALGEDYTDAYTAVLEGEVETYETRLSAVDGHVQVGVVCTDEVAMEQAIDEDTFKGFFADYADRDAVEELAASLLTAANRAFGPKQ